MWDRGQDVHPPKGVWEQLEFKPQHQDLSNLLKGVSRRGISSGSLTGDNTFLHNGASITTNTSTPPAFYYSMSDALNITN